VCYLSHFFAQFRPTDDEDDDDDDDDDDACDNDDVGDDYRLRVEDEGRNVEAGEENASCTSPSVSGSEPPLSSTGGAHDVAVLEEAGEKT